MTLAARRDLLLDLRARIDADGGGALQLFAGTMTDDAEATPPAAPLAILALAVPSFVLDPTEALMTLAQAQGNASVAGQVTWARFVSGSGSGVLLMTAGPPGSGAELIVTDGRTPPTAQVYTGGVITVDASIRWDDDGGTNLGPLAPGRLVLRRPRHADGPVELVLGAGQALPGGRVLGGLALYDNRLPRQASTSSSQPHQAARRAGALLYQFQKQPDRRLGGTAQPMAQAAREAHESGHRWRAAERAAGVAAQAWALAAAAAAMLAQRHEAAAAVRAQAAQVHDVARSLQAQALAQHQVARLTHTGGGQFWRPALGLQALRPQGFEVAAPAGLDFWEPWQTARLIPPGLEVWPRPVNPPGTQPRAPVFELVFECPPLAPGAAPALIFGRVCYLPPVGPLAPLYILPARFYMAVHSLQAWRLPDLLPIPVLSFGFQADQGSFGWSFDVTTRLSAFDDLAPASGVPARLRVEADGLRFEMVIDSLAHSEAFGQRTVSVSGRSPTALLASPYARETERLATAARNAQQLALEALEATGFAMDWTLPDWLVPAGAWSHSGTPLAAVQAIVSAAGGYLQSHRSADTLIAAHPYPDLPGGVPGGPWAWSDPAVVADVELAPSALVATRIERADGPDINGVYVSGQTQGVLRLYKRSGSAADRLASLVTDPLITADVAARMRGRAVVGAAGPKQRITAILPVLTGGAAPGILSVGQLLQVNAPQPWRGRVRAVSGRFEFGQEVRQQVQIERHLGV